ncbi:MAG: histidinol-phosphatase HisJ family protein [Thermodesulfobacteriota bacterium]
MPLFDSHVHTELCNHAQGPMACFLARTRGLSGLCFLDHLTLRPEDARLSMSPEEAPLYYAATRRLSRANAGGPEVLVGLEIDYAPDLAAPAKEVAMRFDFDLLAMSVHFVDEINLVSRRATRDLSTPREELAHRYLDLVLSALSDPYFQVLGHMDCAKKFFGPIFAGMEPRFREIFTALADLGIACEINTSGFDHPVSEPYPSPALFTLMKKAGVDITLGSDAHKPCEVGRHFDKTAALLRDAGYKEFVTFSRRKRKRHPLP